MNQYKVWEIRAMPNMPQQEIAQELLEEVAREVQPIMIKHKWSVDLLSEFMEKGVLGMNIGYGKHIKLKLRKNEDLNEFMPMHKLIDAMLHELCHNDLYHNKHDKLDGKFNSLWDSVREEYFNDLRSGSRPPVPHTRYPSNHGMPHASHTCYPSNHGTRDYPSNHGTYDYPSDHGTDYPSNHGTMDYPSNHGTYDYPSNHGTWDYPSNHEIYPSNHGTYDYSSNDGTCDYPSNDGTYYDNPSHHTSGDSLDHVEEATNTGPLILVFVIVGMIIFMSKVQIPVLLFVCVAACFFFMLAAGR